MPSCEFDTGDFGVSYDSDQYAGGELQSAGAAAHQTFRDENFPNPDMTFSLSGTLVPEPSALLLGMLGLAGCALVGRRSRSIS